MNSDEQNNIQEGNSYYNQSQLTKNSFNANFDIIIKIQGHQSRGFALKKHIVYHIKGVDKHGEFDVWRRFNQFNQLRVALVKSWPGCLIPSLPSKNPLTKNQQQNSRKRQRYLDYFLKKMAQRSYLYFSQEFQAFIRSTQINLSDKFSKWPSPTSQGIINRYKQTFSILSGKAIVSNVITEIFDFAKILEQNITILEQYRKIVKQLAISKDVYNAIYKNFFKIIKSYQITMMSEYVNSPIYQQNELEKVNQSIQLVNQYNKNNPYWMLYDMIKNEERDAKAFIDLLKSIQHYGHLAKNYQQKIKDNINVIFDTSEDKFNIKAMTMKGTPQEKKYQLQVDNQTLKIQRQRAISLRDIIIALVYYIQIKEYKQAKIHFYKNIIYKFTLFQCSSSQNMKGIWEKVQKGIQSACESLME